MLDNVVQSLFQLDGLSAPRKSREIANLKNVVERQENARCMCIFCVISRIDIVTMLSAPW